MLFWLLSKLQLLSCTDFGKKVRHLLYISYFAIFWWNTPCPPKCYLWTLCHGILSLFTIWFHFHASKIRELLNCCFTFWFQSCREIEDTILLALKNPDVYDKIARGTRCRFETNRPRAVLFEGPPGEEKHLK